jgi:RimJ/RimL family protein N-acetyltransferase
MAYCALPKQNNPMGNFESSRLRMRFLQASDQALYLRCYTHPDLMKHISQPLSETAAIRSFFAARKFNQIAPIRRRTWMMQEKQADQPIGLLALICHDAILKPMSADIGAIILDPFQNQGFAAEAIRALVELAFAETDITTLRTRHSKMNYGANGLMQKLGFRHEEQADLHHHWYLSRESWQRELSLTAMK